MPRKGRALYLWVFILNLKAFVSGRSGEDSLMSYGENSGAIFCAYKGSLMFGPIISLRVETC